MSQKLIKKGFINNGFIVVISLISIMLGNSSVRGQASGSTWIKTYKPGGADLNVLTIDKNALIFVDSLMKRDDIEVKFLGSSDNLKWKQAGDVTEISSAWDQAKKLERASMLRERYGKGEIGTTDEPIRGVKVVWGPKKPDLFKMNKRIGLLENLNDSLRTALLAINSEHQKKIKALEDSLENREANVNMTSIAEISTSYFDWEVKSGFFFWSAGNPYDLAVPYVGIVLKRQLWAFELQGGLTPWSRSHSDGNRSDAFLMGTMNIFPDNWYEFKLGFFSGWEFLTNSDNWTMKVMGITAGPNIQCKLFKTFIGYNLSKLSTLVEPSRWTHSGMITMSFNLRLNKL